MSKSKNKMSEPRYGQITLKCPQGDELGAIMVNPRFPTREQTFHRLDAIMKAPDITKRPEDGELGVARTRGFSRRSPGRRGGLALVRTLTERGGA
jgi:hypothetical protein